AGSQSNGTAVFNNNLNWTYVDENNAAQAFMSGGGDVVVDPKTPSTIYHVETRTNTFPLVRKSTSGGTAGSWSTILSVNSTNLALVMDPINPSRLLVGATNPVLGLPVLQESSDGGGSWLSLNVPTLTSVTGVAISTYQGTFAADPDFPTVTDKGTNTYDPD